MRTSVTIEKILNVCLIFTAAVLILALTVNRFITPIPDNRINLSILAPALVFFAKSLFSLFTGKIFEAITYLIVVIFVVYTLFLS